MRFGVFEVDKGAREVRKAGRKVPLQDQPFEILCALLEHPGEVVSREEIQRRLWPDGVHVDFERGLNKAVVKLREALGDVAENPRFVETLPRRGYRFIAPLVDSPAGTEARAAASDLPERPRLTQRALPLVAAALIAFAVVAMWLNRARPPGSSPVRFTVALPPALGLEVYSSASIAFSPDGKRFVFATRGPAGGGLYLRSLDGLEAVRLAGTERARSPFFLSDEWIGFEGGERLRRIATTGGDSQTLSEMPFPAGATSAGPDGSIVFVPSFTGGLFRLAKGGTRPVRLTRPDRARGEGAHIWPRALPDGRGILFTIWAGSRSLDQSEIAVLPPSGGRWKVVLDGGSFARYVPSGHLVFLRGGTLHAARFDLDRLAVTGPSVTVLERVASDASGAALYDVSRSGSLAYVAGGTESQQRRLVVVDRNGVASPMRNDTGPFVSPRFAPDGRRLALWIEEAETTEVWLHEPGQEALTRVTFHLDDHSPAWSPDGRSLAFESGRDFVHHLFVRDLDAEGRERQITSGEYHHYLGDWSPDGRWLAFMEFHPETAADVWVARADGSLPARPVARSAYSEREAAFSRDGRYLAYVSDESGQGEVYVQPFPGPGPRVQVSVGGGHEPAWSKSTDELFYRIGRRFMAVRFRPGAVPQADKPVFLFEGDYHDNIAPTRSYDVAADGRFALVADPPLDQMPREVRVVLGFGEELKRLVPPR